ncbi:hypothetical protein [Imhoffiella purpurea]|uniref:Uncharacterized protein n=1 Tax=Imhoffiella purpurea TaxID=1249627 RepID=W9VNA4_9GAMM|nr:hypothetical protein [Imhoffiella purpurea]EXJ11970.1 hypothetical protein D779_4224 [Imhoffiella purpurea]
MTTTENSGDEPAATPRRRKTPAAAKGDPAETTQPSASRQKPPETRRTRRPQPKPVATETRDTYRSTGRVWPD